jgi:adenosine deaminase/aminodeoxyfutalosine deaminase
VTSPPEINAFLRQLPKAELHLHLEGTLTPDRVMSLAQKYSVPLDWPEINSRYTTRNFTQFLELYKWGTSFLREPEDYALLAQDAAAALHEQGVIYAEITLSIGIMLLRKQNVAANFAAIRNVFQQKAAAATGPQVQFIFDAVRQFGPAPAMEIARIAADLRNEGVVAFGLGGDELSLPFSQFREAYAHAAKNDLHLVAHAGETGGPEQILDAIEILGAERIGHGIAAIRSTALMNTLTERKIPLELCPTSNLCTNALNIQINSSNSNLTHHPLPKLFRYGIPVTLSTDDPAMFHVNLVDEYSAAHHKMGLTLDELLAINRNSFEYAFLPEPARQSFLSQIQSFSSTA